MQFDRVSARLALCLMLALWGMPGLSAAAQDVAGATGAGAACTATPCPTAGTPPASTPMAHQPLAMLGVLAGLLAMAALERRLARHFRPRPASS
jgi:hypothetical protein